MRSPAEFVEQVIKSMREALPRGRAVVACSGGVDSTVCAVLAHQAFGERAHAVFLDTGFMRADEAPSVERALAGLGISLEVFPVAPAFSRLWRASPIRRKNAADFEPRSTLCLRKSSPKKAPRPSFRGPLPPMWPKPEPP